MIVEDLVSKIKPLTSNQSFITILFLLTLIVTIGFWNTSVQQSETSNRIISQVKKSDSINSRLINTLNDLNYNIKFNNRNNLSKNESLTVIEKSLASSKCQILLTRLSKKHQRI